MNKFYNSSLNTFNRADTVESNRVKCAWCNSIISPNEGYIVFRGQYRSGYIYICPNCNEVILYNKERQTVFPQAKFGDSFSKLPEDVNAIYEECRDCYSVGAYTSVILLARKLLMHIAVDCGAEENKTFVEYVDYLERCIDWRMEH